MAHQLLNHAIQVQRVICFTFGKPDIFQPLGEVVGFQIFVARKRQLVDGWTFQHGDHKNIVLLIQTDIFKKTGAVHGAQRFRCFGLIQCVATLNREVGEHGTCTNTLQAVDTDVADLER